MLLLQPETIEYNRMMYCQSSNRDKVIFLHTGGKDHVCMQHATAHFQVCALICLFKSNVFIKQFNKTGMS